MYAAAVVACCLFLVTSLQHTAHNVRLSSIERILRQYLDTMSHVDNMRIRSLASRSALELRSSSFIILQIQQFRNFRLS